MNFSRGQRIIINTVLGLAAVLAIGIGVALGVAFATSRNIETTQRIEDSEPALPTRVYDINGRLITEFFGEQHRSLVSLDELPKHFIHALITREDETFFEHPGFDFLGTVRAAWDVALYYLTNGRRGDFRGASTITQQLAGELYADRSDISVTRKIRELWWALQLERHYTKNEILEQYVNKVFFGHATYGVGAASQFYFNKPASDVTIAESAMLVIQLNNPAAHSPINNPEVARERQRFVLNRMVDLGYATQDEVDLSFDEYWNNYDFTRLNRSNALAEREDRAPAFSYYVLRQLQERYLLGSANVFEDGYSVYTTLNLDHQEAAERYMQSGLRQANATFQSNVRNRVEFGESEFAPIIELLSLSLDISQLQVADAQQRKQAEQYFLAEVNPILDVVSMIFGDSAGDEIRHASRLAYSQEVDERRRATVEGALVTIDNDTGYISAMIGGSTTELNNQFNRAVDARVEPGSSFKPLYYAAAIENEVVTPATRIYDSPMVFWNDDGTPYVPYNYRGEWEGAVRVRHALATSMNVPSLRVLNLVGFDESLDAASRMLGIGERQMIERGLVRKYPVGLGVVSVSPLEMAKAFATFPNEGRRVEPLAIRYIEDRNGNIVVNPEQDLREAQQRNARDQQILSEQTAYIMTDILESVVDWGTLRWPRSLVDGFDVPMAGKTGTTQNWADAWTVGFSPYLTTAVWIGFDEGGNSLGTNQTGAVTAGPIWARYMDDVHSGLRDRDFQRPPSGIVEVEVTAETGLLPPQGYEGQVITELFRRGTEPTRFDDSREYRADQQTEIVDRMQASLGSSDALRSMNLDLSEPLTLSDPLRDRGPSGGGNLFLDEPPPEEEAEESGNIYLD